MDVMFLTPFMLVNGNLDAVNRNLGDKVRIDTNCYHRKKVNFAKQKKRTFAVFC